MDNPSMNTHWIRFIKPTLLGERLASCICDLSSPPAKTHDGCAPCAQCAQGLQAYHIFVIFFTRAKFLENKIYTEKTRKLQQNTQKIANFGIITAKYTVNCQFFALNL